MTSSSEEHSRYPPYSRRTASTDSGNVFSFAPPEPVLPRNGDYPSYIPATELDGETELDDDPINWSSHSRHLTTGPTATSISFPLTPRTPGPLTPYTPSSQPPQEPRRLASIQSRINPTPSTGESGGRFAFMPPTRGTTQSQDQRLSSLQNRIGPTPSTGDSADMMFAFMPPSRETIQSQEQRVDSIQGRSGPTPSTGESAGMMFTFLPPPQESAQSQPTTSSRLSSITELSALNTSRRNTTDSKDDPLGLLPETAAGNATKNIYSASDLYAAAVPPESPVEVPSYTLSAPWIDEEEDSPCEEVRASVSNTDDPDIPCVTWRMWAVGLPLCALVGGFQMYAELRIPWPAIGYMVLLIWVYLAGKTLELLPIKSWDIGPFVFDLNPGPFSIKEHAAALVLASSSADPISVVPVARFIFGLETIFISGPPNMASQIVLILACPIIGISVAGIFRRLLIHPARMIWPNVLSVCAVMNVFHAEFGEDGAQTKLAGMLFFATATFASALYSFLPGLLFTGLSKSSFVCWAWPDSKVVNQLFGTISGLGMSGLTLDWSVISTIGNPLLIPWWATAHWFAGFVLFFWIVTPILYYLNVWKTGHLPMMDLSLYDRFAEPYDIARIIDPSVIRLNVTAYMEYSQPYLTVANTVSNLISYTTPTLLIVHTALYYGSSIIRWLRSHRDVEPDDIHAKLMRTYPDTPTWWYLTSLAVSFPLVLIVLAIETQLDTPAWVAVLTVLLGFVFILPVSYICAATTTDAVLLSFGSELLIGILLPGRPLPNVLCKAMFQTIIVSGLIHMQWLKFGHYMKIPPRAILCVQVVGALIVNLVQFGVKRYLLANVADICQMSQPEGLICPYVWPYFMSGAFWGLIGPERVLGRRAQYFSQIFGLASGALLPIPLWWWTRRKPKSWIRKIHLPMFIWSYNITPTASGTEFASFTLVGFISQYLIRRKRFRWWFKYNYVLAGALDLGNMLGLLVIFFAVLLPLRGDISLDWWGNTVWQNTGDFEGVPFYSTDPIQGFAPPPSA